MTTPAKGQTCRRLGLALLALPALLLIASPGVAQDYDLFDRFSLSLGASQLGLSTEIRLDSNNGDFGTVLNFEDDLGLDSSKLVPSLGFRARLGKRHLIDAFWTKADRNSTSQALTDIDFGDIEIPEGAAVSLSYDQEAIGAGYSYYFLLRDRWGLAVRGGLRLLQIQAFLEVLETDIDLSDGGDLSAPLPFVGFSFRYGITPKVRLISDFGWLSVKIGDIDGSQLLGTVDIEYLAWKHASFGATLGASSIDVENTGNDDFTGSADSRNSQISLFAKARW